MDLQQCYSLLGGDYQNVSHRLFNDAMVTRFLLKFLDDRSFADLCKAMDEKDYAGAFIAAHTLKGVCQNLSLDRLYSSAQPLTEALRGDTPDVKKAESLFLTVKEDYQITVDAIGRFQAEA